VRQLRDRDFLEDVDGDLFCVIGNVHPPGRAICYLKYVKGSVEKAVRAKWGRGGELYSRILPHYSALGYVEAREFLKAKKPSYVRFDEVYNIELTEVPLEKVARHYKPEERLRELSSGKSLDKLEQHALELAALIADESGVKLDDMGVSGSILLKIHNPEFSDVDLIVYGRANSLRVKEVVNEFLNLSIKGFERPKGDMLKAWAEDIVRIHPSLSLNEAMKLYSAKWNRALYKGRQFSIHPVKLEAEVREAYGDRIYKPVGEATVKCKIADDTDSLFLPCSYAVEDVQVLSCSISGKLDIREVISHEGLYSDIASRGEYVVVRGKLEEVYYNRSGDFYHVIHVGSYEMRGQDFIKPIRWRL